MGQPTPLNIEALIKLSYERSKVWASFFEEVSAANDDVVVDLNEIDEIFSSEDEHEDGNAAEEAVEVDESLSEEVLQDITNHTRMATDKVGLFDQSKLVREFRKHAIDCAENEIDEVNDDAGLQDILNQTIRKCEEEGFERVLNTFDAKKIEEKVGSWLRRNSSGTSYYPTLPTIVISPAQRRFAHEKALKRHVCSKQADADSDDSESLHSADTARYILSSRKRRAANKRVSTSCTTMTIKKFCLQQSKRDALRAKYACPDYDEEHFNKLRHRRAERHQPYVIRDNNLLNLASESHSIRRRKMYKHLRKRHATTNSGSMSCSTDDEYETALVARKHICCARTSNRNRRLKKMEPLRYRSMHYERAARHCFSMTSSSSSSYLSAHSYTRNDRHLCHAATDMDTRPCLRESECSCCNDNYLCSEIRHLADTSTENWIVENCNTSMKSLTLAKSNSRHLPKTEKSKDIYALKMRIENPQPKRAQHENIMHSEEHNDADRNTSPLPLIAQKTPKPHSQNDVIKAFTAKKSIKNSNKLQSESTKKELIEINNAAKSKTKQVANKPKQKRLVKKNDDNTTSDKELELALKLSKQEYKKEQRKLNKLQKVTEKNIKKKKRKDEVDENVVTEKHKPLFQNESQKKENASIINVDATVATTSQMVQDDEKTECVIIDSSPEKTLKPQPKSVKLRKLAKIQQDKTQQPTEDTFFISSNNICNSTAFEHDTARTKQFDELTKKTPRLATRSAAASTGSASVIAPASSSSKTIDTKDDNDCTVVTSTTSDVHSLPRTQRNTAKGILLYTPNDKTLAPAHSFKNGTFQITKDHLSTVIGEQAASKFLKYYVGRRCFNSNSTIYFRPPQTDDGAVCTESSDEDIWDCIGRYGDIYESIDKGNKSGADNDLRE